MKIPFELELIGSKHCLLQDLNSPPLKGLALALPGGQKSVVKGGCFPSEQENFPPRTPFLHAHPPAPPWLRGTVSH